MAGGAYHAGEPYIVFLANTIQLFGRIRMVVSRSRGICPPYDMAGDAYHARDCFMPPERFGSRYDELPALQPPQMREQPWLAAFLKVWARRNKALSSRYSAFTRCSHCQPCMVYEMQKWGREGGCKLRISRAIVLQ